MEGRPAAVFIGNSIFGDDRIGLVVGDLLRERLEGIGFDVHVVERTGLALLDCLEGHDSAVVVDSVCSEVNKVGEVLTLSPQDFATVKPASPHFSGVPEALQLMEQLEIGVPEVMILGVNVKDPYTLSDSMSEELEGMKDAIAREVYARIAVRQRERVLA